MFENFGSQPSSVRLDVDRMDLVGRIQRKCRRRVHDDVATDHRLCDLRTVADIAAHDGDPIA